MSRPAGPPKLEPDRKGSGIWYIYYREARRPREQSTGHRSRPEAEAFFGEWLQERTLRLTSAVGPRRPDQMTIDEALALYADGHGSQVADPDRMARDIEALAPWWGQLRVSEITNERATAYIRWRKERIVERRRRLSAEAAARWSRPPKPVQTHVSDSTPRRELATLNAASEWCRRNQKITYAPIVPLPPQARPRDRWLTRDEIARLMRAGRTNPRLRHVVDFVRVAVRLGARKTAVLTLRTTQHMDGGWLNLESGIVDLLPLGLAQTNKRRPKLPMPDGLLCWARAKMKRGTTDHLISINRKRPVADVKKGLAELCRRAGLQNVTPHTMRHTAVTWMAQAKVPFWQISGYTGMSENMIRNTYGHHHPDYLAEAKAAMSGGRRSPTHPQRMTVLKPTGAA